MAHCSSLKRKVPAIDATEDDFDFDDNLVNLTDTEAAISLVISSEEGHQICKGALIHQLYAVLSNKTTVDVEILKLRQNRGVKLLNFHLAGASTTESQFVMMSRDYFADLNDKLNATVSDDHLHGSLSRFIPLATKYLDRVSILESDLLISNTRVNHGVGINQETVVAHKAKCSDVYDDQLSVEDIHNIVTAGFLSKRRDLEASSNKVLWFAHPILGNLRRWIDSSRKEIMGFIKSTRYKELSDRELKKKEKFISSPLGLKFHLYDCVGNGLLYTVTGPRSSLVYRLSSMKEGT